MNLHVLSFVTCKFHPKVFGFLDLCSVTKVKNHVKLMSCANESGCIFEIHSLRIPSIVFTSLVQTSQL